MNYFVVCLIAFFANIPLGYLRENTPKFSGKWFFLIHASIPLIIFARVTTDVSPWIIPATISLAIIAQVMGGQWRKSKMTIEDEENLDQIGSLNRTQKKNIKDKDIIIALLNMGGPRTNEDVKDFQKKLFADPLLIRFPLSFILQDFFAWVLIKFRLKAVKERYQEIGGGSPIYKSTTAQANALRKELQNRGFSTDVTFSFNYSPPFSDDTIQKAKRAGKKYLMPLSLYPHYSKATTGSNIHYLQKAINDQNADIQLVEPSAYYIHNGYIQAFADRIHETIKEGESLDNFYLLFSAHGLPLYFLKEGDPYPFQITQTVSKILARLNRTENWTLSYQSSVGPLQWLKPGTEEMFGALARRNIKKLLVVPVSFVGDHIETIHEIDIEYREVAEELGITDLRMSKAIECHPGFIHALADTVEKVLIPTQKNTSHNHNNNLHNSIKEGVK